VSSCGLGVVFFRGGRATSLGCVGNGGRWSRGFSGLRCGLTACSFDGASGGELELGHVPVVVGDRGVAVLWRRPDPRLLGRANPNSSFPLRCTRGRAARPLGGRPLRVATSVRASVPAPARVRVFVGFGGVKPVGARTSSVAPVPAARRRRRGGTFGPEEAAAGSGALSAFFSPLRSRVRASARRRAAGLFRRFHRMSAVLAACLGGSLLGAVHFIFGRT